MDKKQNDMLALGVSKPSPEAPRKVDRLDFEELHRRFIVIS